MQKYGVENQFQRNEIKELIKNNNKLKYGVENPQQNQEIQEKTQKNAKKYKEYKMPSGIIRKVQGYEPFALDELVKLYTEEQIITDRKDIPRIKYNYNDKEKCYFPDIYIPDEKYIIEVKSTWTLKIDKDKNYKKAEACKIEGYKYEIWVYDNKGNKKVI